MKIPDIFGRERNINISKYYVDWNGKEASKFQFEVKQFFKDFWRGDCVCSEFLIPSTRLRIDLINFSKGIVVESSGEQHFEWSEKKNFFHKNRLQFGASLKRDDRKFQYITTTLQYQFIELRMKDMKELSYDFLLKQFDIDILENYS